MADTEARIAALEAQVDLLRRAIGLLTVGMAPTVAWLDASFAAMVTDRAGLIASVQPPRAPEPDDREEPQ